MTTPTPTNAIIVIPARYGSTRFPGKPLAKETGKFLIQHVVEQAQKVPLAAHVVVATDDHRIFDTVTSFGARAVMTSPTHPSGTDRIAEVMQNPEFASSEIVVNIQGDEPEIDPALVNNLIASLANNPSADMATAASWFSHWHEVENPNIVKLVTDENDFALYFSRSVIPHERDKNPATQKPLADSLYRKHLGLYAYRRQALMTLAATSPCQLEQLEKLEQLRALYLGMKIHVSFSRSAPHGIDTPGDYAAFVKRFSQTPKVTT